MYKFFSIFLGFFTLIFLILPNITKAQEESISFVFAGDMMLDRHVGILIANNKNNPQFLIQNLLNQKVWQNTDIVSANLEGAVTNNGKHYPPANGNDFAFSPELVSKFTGYGFNFFNTANNHVADQGRKGEEESESNLSKIKVDFSGCRDGVVSEDCSVKIVEKNGLQIAMIGASMVYRRVDENKLIEIVRKSKQEADLVVVQMHWGQEYKTQFNRTQSNLAHKLIDAGADLIIGHHPHVAQGVEVYNGKVIFYSLGNFIFDQYFSRETQRSLIVKANYQNKNWQLSLIPITSSRSQLSLMDEKNKQVYLRQLMNVSKLDKNNQLNFLNGFISLQN